MTIKTIVSKDLKVGKDEIVFEVWHDNDKPIFWSFTIGNVTFSYPEPLAKKLIAELKKIKI